jgi:hypothetical protein
MRLFVETRAQGLKGVRTNNEQHTVERRVLGCAASGWFGGEHGDLH